MDVTPYALSVARGDGLVTRVGDVVMYIADGGSSADRMLAAVEAAAGSEDPGAAVTQQLAFIALGADSSDIAPFGVVAPSADGLLVLVRRSVVAEIGTTVDNHHLSGERAFTWVDRVIRDPVLRIAIATESGVSGHPHTDLRAGVVPGGGFVLHCVNAAHDPPNLGEPVAAQTMPGPETTLRMQPAVAAAPRGGPLAETSAHTPVAGFLSAEDGAVYPLDRNYVIGRDPLRDDAVRTAAASPIVVHDDRHVSRVHAYVTIDGTSVAVRDAATPAGTFIAAPDAEDWTRIGTAPTELEPGWILRVGDRILTFHTTG